MNPQDIMTFAQQVYASHGRDVAFLVAGAALSNPGTCAFLAFAAVTKIPGVGGWMGRNPDKVKAWIDGFTAKVDELEDKYAAEQLPTPGGKPDAQKTPPASTQTNAVADATPPAK